MSTVITISGTPILFPSSGEDPNWAPAIIQFAQLTAKALNTVVGTFDVPQQAQDISGAGNNPTSSPVDISALNFPTSQVRSVFVKYAIYRTALAPTVALAETGNLIAVYNPNNSTGFKWEVSRDGDGNSLVSFSVTDTGQFQYTTQQIGTTNHIGKIVFSAVALLQNP